MVDSDYLLERFLSYVRIDTQSDPHSKTHPSTEKQWVLVRKLDQELRELGLRDVCTTDHGYVLATLPANTTKTQTPRVALLAHVDTATNCSGLAKPIVHRNYRGDPIVLPEDPDQILTVDNTPLLREKIGHDIITASGKTLLGGDDKSGIAIIVTALRHLIAHPEIRHGRIRVCFTPDEEIGQGTEFVSLEDIGADVGYTFDGDGVGTIDWETFSAEKAVITIHGIEAHPGMAKGIMVNAMRLAGRLLADLPMDRSPERTSGREGFVHPDEFDGNAERVRIEFILRDFELDGLAVNRRILEDAIARLRTAEPRARIDMEVKPQYRNMRYWLDKDARPVEYAMEAVRRLGLAPVRKFVRGGTDGSRLTERGLPTPNLSAGYYDVHSMREWASLQDMTTSADTLVHLVQVWEEKTA